MNRIKAIFLLLCFLITNSGIAISAHWCGNKLTHISFLVEHQDCACGKKASMMKPGCCKDRIATLKAGDDLSTQESVVLKAPTVKGPIMYSPVVEIVASSLLHYAAPDFYRPPPGKPKLPAYILNRVFLI